MADVLLSLLRNDWQMKAEIPVPMQTAMPHNSRQLGAGKWIDQYKGQTLCNRPVLKAQVRDVALRIG